MYSRLYKTPLSEAAQEIFRYEPEILLKLRDVARMPPDPKKSRWHYYSELKALFLPYVGMSAVDIWGANVQAHPTKRSPNKHSSQNVPTENNNVHHMNENREECSPNEQQCSQAKHEASGKQEEGSKNITEVRTVSNTLPTYELTADRNAKLATSRHYEAFLDLLDALLPEEAQEEFPDEEVDPSTWL